MSVTRHEQLNHQLILKGEVSYSVPVHPDFLAPSKMAHFNLKFKSSICRKGCLFYPIEEFLSTD
jgi:predicted component of viral defense system (DUF524 family)